mmetsp:Transcript_25405/g.84035  ORF Transcript_25405/g.84035 Transcript_25405/m.84035 type:complete len:172 (-) Transcript_25405:59-574(-)
MAIEAEEVSHRRCMMARGAQAFRSLRIHQDKKCKGLTRDRAFSATFTCISMTDRDMSRNLLLPFQARSSWPAASHYPHMRSIDTKGNFVAGGGYSKFGRTAQVPLGLSIGREGNFIAAPKVPSRTRRRSWGSDLREMQDVFKDIRIVRGNMCGDGRFVSEWSALSGVYFLE